jgi:hypothetical protein
MAATYQSDCPCRRGHHGLRYVSTRACVECVRDREVGRQRPPRRSTPDPYRLSPIVAKPVRPPAAAAVVFDDLV